MIRTAVFPRRYVQGRGALAQFGAEAAKLGSRVFGLCDTFALDQVSARLGLVNGCLLYTSRCV